MLPEVLPKNGNEVPWKDGQCRVKRLGRQDLAWRIPWNSRAHTTLGLSLLPAPLWHLSVILCVLSPTRTHSQLSCLCASSLHSLRFYSTHHVLLSSLEFILVHLTGKGHVDPAQPLNDRSCPHTINTSKSKTFPWLHCIHRPKITLCPQHTKHPVCCGHDYFGYFAFPICLKH